MKILRNKTFQKFITFSCILFFESLSFYYLFKIYTFDHGSRALVYLLIVFFIVSFLYIIIKSAQRIFKDNILNGQKELFVSTILFILALTLKFFHLNQILGINLNFSINYPIFLTVAALLFTSAVLAFFVVPKISDLKFSEKKTLIIIIVSVTLFYFILSAVAYLKFQTSAFDLGIFDQVVWKYSQLKVPFDSINGINDLADHFEPILFLFGLLYRVWSSVYTLLLAEAFIVAVGFYPIYQLGKKYLENKKSAIYIGLGYLFSLGIMNAIRYPVHPGTWLPTFYAFAIYFIDKKKYSLYFLFLLLAALSKESSFIHILFIGIFVAIYFKERIAGLATALLSICYYVFVFKFAMSYFNHGLPYPHGVMAISNNPKVFIEFVIRHPIETIRTAFDNPVKSQTLYLTLAAVGFLAIFSIGLILLIAPFLVERLLTTQPNMMTMSFHYSAPITAIVFIVAIFALRKLTNQKLKYALSLFIFLCSFTFMFSNYFYASPLNGYFSSSSYKIGERENMANEIINKIPENASITSQDAFVTHLSHRDIIRLFDGNTYDTDYILLGKTADYGSWPVTSEVIQNEIAKLRKNDQFTVGYENTNTILFKKTK